MARVFVKRQAKAVRVPRPRGDSGVSMPEFIVAALMSMTLAAVTAALVVSALNISARNQTNAGTLALTQETMSNFAQYASGATRVVAASTTSITLLYDRGGGVCERHVYTFSGATPAISLTHVITSVRPSTNEGCVAVATPLINGTVGSATTITELSNLLAGSFSYFGPDGMQVPQSGDTGYSAASAVPLCKLGSVQMTVSTSIIAEGSRTSNVETIRSAFRANVLGVGC